MAKKFVNGENLVYALNLFEDKIKEVFNGMFELSTATKNDIKELFKFENRIVIK